MNARDPHVVNHAVDEAERILSLSPLGSSESLAEGLRRLKVPPILICFCIDLQHNLVEISTSAS